MWGLSLRLLKGQIESDKFVLKFKLHSILKFKLKFEPKFIFKTELNLYEDSPSVRTFSAEKYN